MKVSLVLRTKNEASGLRALQPLLAQQTRQIDEIIVVDSGSTDETCFVAESMGAKIIHLSPDEFTFGRALNEGLTIATGDIVLSLSAHCLPSNAYWVEKLLVPFVQKEVVAVFGRQIPFKTASLMEQHALSQTYPLDGQKVSPELFSNAHCAFRRAAWERVAFDEELTGSEDIAWAQQVRAFGAVVYVPESTVFHSHEETFSQVYQRSYREMLAFHAFENSFRRDYGFFGALLRVFRASLLDYVFLFSASFSFLDVLKWMLLIPVYRVAAYYGNYQAIRDSRGEG